MNRLEFFKLAMRKGYYAKKAWLISAFSILDQSDKEPDEYQIALTEKGYVTKADGKEIILSRVKDNPVYRFDEKIDLMPDDIPNLDKKITSTVGNYLVNWILLVYPFCNTIPYMEGKITIPTIEDIIATKLEDDVPEDQRKPGRIYVSQYEDFVEATTYLTGLSTLCVVTATEKNLLPPPGIKSLKQELVKKYGKDLHRWDRVAEVEKKLLEMDKEWLKDDPSYGRVVKGKVANIARKKMYLMFGAESGGFTSNPEANPVVNSLEEGWPTDPDKLVDMFNSSRFGSFSRGKETQKGGVVSKVLLRSASNYQVEGDDCGTNVGLKKDITDSNYQTIVGRYVMEGGKLTLVADNKTAKTYIGKTVQIRSPMYCKQEGERICKVCAGSKLSINPKGVSLSLTEISGIILNASMKAMHGKELKVTRLDLDTYLT